MSQPPRDFRILQTQTTSNQPPRQFRPVFTDAVPRELQEAFRQTIDNVQAQRTAYSPMSIYSAGMGAALKVPVGASASDYGSGLGLTVTLSRIGNWLITAAVCLNIVGDANQLFTLTLQVGPNPQGTKALAQAAATTTQMMHQTWQITSPTGIDLCRLLIKKAGGAGTSNVDVQHTSLTATWQGT